MIKISSFYPFQSLLRITQEFHEDKAVVKMKSLTFEREFEFEYKDVGEISDAFSTDNNQMSFGFWLLGFTMFTLVLFRGFVDTNPILLRMGQILYVCGLFLFVTSFKKSWQIYVSDKNDNLLTYIKQTHQNRELIPQVMGIIKNKLENIQEITTANPFPEEKSAFEHVEYDIPNLRKTTDRFYENEIIGLQKSMFWESVYNIKYSQLSKKIYRGKSGSDILGFSLLIAGSIISIVVGFIHGFGVNLGITPSRNLGYFVFTLLVLSLISWPLGFIKRERIGLYAKNGSVGYWTYINQNNKDNVEKVIEFVLSKVPAEEKK